MTSTVPHFTELTPVILDHNRVILSARISNLNVVSNVSFNFDLPAQPRTIPSQNIPDNYDEQMPESPYPNIELAILDQDNNQVAHAMIIEQKDPLVTITLHIRNPASGDKYIAQAIMIHKQNVIHSFSVPFTLGAHKPDNK